MSDQEENTGEPTAPIIVNFAARVKESDKNYIVENFFAPGQKVHIGFSALVEKLKNPSVKVKLPDPVQIEKPLPPNCFVIEFTPAFIEQLTKLRRYLKSKEMIPQDSTEIEFMQKFISSASEAHVKKNYDFLNR